VNTLRNNALSLFSQTLNRLANASLRVSLSARKFKARANDYWMHRDLVKCNDRFNKIGRSRRAFILGTGPSINKLNLEHLRGETTFAVNGFWKHPVNELFSPEYYCLLDSLFFGTEPEAELLLQNIQTSMSESRFVIPALQHRRWRDVCGPASMLDPIFVCFAGQIDRDLKSLPNLAYDIPYVHNVAQFAVLTAIYLGHSPIYLLGCDHNFMQNHGVFDHFHTGNSVDVALTIPRLEHTFEKASTVWRDYRKIHEIALKHEIQILNATDDSLLDVFPRTSYEDLFAHVQAPK
jgi:hypothetical protein